LAKEKEGCGNQKKLDAERKLSRTSHRDRKGIDTHSEMTQKRNFRSLRPFTGKKERSCLTSNETRLGKRSVEPFQKEEN